MTDFAEDVCDIIGILNQGQLKIKGTLQTLLERTKAVSLEKAYLKLVGGQVEREKLLAWRN